MFGADPESTDQVAASRRMVTISGMDHWDLCKSLIE